jgi:hypothetical protein
MPDIKKVSFGQLGNTWGPHPNTDHPNTAGLDEFGEPGLELYIDEDVVKSFNDNRPLINLETNDQVINNTIDEAVSTSRVSAFIQNEYSQWALTIGPSASYTDPEDFLASITVTPLLVAPGTAYTPSAGYIRTTTMRLVALFRNDGSSIYLDPHTWLYSNTIVVDEPNTTYAGLYRPLYTDVATSELPTNYSTYTYTIVQISTTGNPYTFQIYTQNDVIIPFTSSEFSVSNVDLNFYSNSYPGYDRYPDTFFQLTSSEGQIANAVISIGNSSLFPNYQAQSGGLQKLEYKFLASNFNASAGLFVAQFQESAFRTNQSANINRIENDTNFVRVLTGVYAYNQTSRIYFHPQQDTGGILQPLVDSRDFLGNEKYSFEVAFYSSNQTTDWEWSGLALMNAETGDTTQFTSVNQSLGSYFVAEQDAAFTLYGSYGYKVGFFSNAALCYGSTTFANQSEVYIRAYMYIGPNYKVTAAGNSIRVLSLLSTGSQELVSLYLLANGATNSINAWSTFIDTIGFTTSTTNFTTGNYHKIELHFKAGTGANGGGQIWVDDALLASNLTLNLSSFLANTILVGPSTTGINSIQGSYLYFDDIKVDSFPTGAPARIPNYHNLYTKVFVTSPETRGYQDFGLAKTDPNITLSITGTYGFYITVNGFGSPVLVTINVIATDTLNTIATKLNAAFAATVYNGLPAVFAYARAFLSPITTGWDLRIYSQSSGTYSTMLLGIYGVGDLNHVLGGAGFLAAVPGVSDWNIINDITLTDHQYIVTNGVATQPPPGSDAGTVAYQLYYALLAAGTGFPATAPQNNFTVGLNNTVQFDHSNQLYVYSNSSTQGYQAMNMSVPDPALNSLLNPLTTYYFKVAVNGGPLTEYNIITTTDTSYQGIVNSLNAVLAGIITVSFSLSNDILFTSDSYGPFSSILTADGTSGTSLFGFGYPAAGFTPSSLHLTPVQGTGTVISIRPCPINTFTIITDSITERAAYGYKDTMVYVTPTSQPSTRDLIDTYTAFLTATSATRWSTQNSRTIALDLSAHPNWISGSYITKLYTLTIGTNNYLLVGNSSGQVFYFLANVSLYNEDIIISSSTPPDPATFVYFVSGNLQQASIATQGNPEFISSFFTYIDTVNNKTYLFVLAQSYLYWSDVTAGLTQFQVFNAINTSSSLSVSNVNDLVFSEIRAATNWNATVSPSLATVNDYIIFVGKGNISTWNYAPILYALYNTGTLSFTWYSESIYEKSQINDVRSISTFNNWSDPQQTYQLFITNNANGPEIWTGNSQNSTTEVGGVGGDNRFVRFSWINPNHENGVDPFGIDTSLSYLSFATVYDSKLFIGGLRYNTNTIGGLYSYGLNQLQNYFTVDSTLATAFVDTSVNNPALYVVLHNGTIGNADPAIAKISQESDQGRAIIVSSIDLQTVENWPTNSAFQVALTGFTVGGIVYDGTYNIVFNGNYSDINMIVTAMNGADLAAAGFKAAQNVSTGLTRDLTPAIAAVLLTDITLSGTTYINNYKIAIQSKTSNPADHSGFTSPTQPTQSNCTITINNPTTGTTVVGTGPNTLEILAGTTANANLQLIDWGNARLRQVKRVSTDSFELNFGTLSYINITPYIPGGYEILTGSFRLKADPNDEIGYSQGDGVIITGTTTLSSLAPAYPSSGSPTPATYIFKVEFDSTDTSGTVQTSRIQCAGDINGSLSGKYFTINTPTRYYYVWYNVTGLATPSVNPQIFGLQSIQVTIVVGSSATTVGNATMAALNSTLDFSATSVSGIVTAANTSIGRLVAASDGIAPLNTSFTISTPTFGTGGDVINQVIVASNVATNMTSLISTINSQISGGVASLSLIGNSTDACDIVITSNTTGNNSSVRIFASDIGNYLFNKYGLDIIPNLPVQGNTGLNTSGYQTLGFTWTNADYFLEYNYPGSPGTGQVRIYIPNGSTRLNSGSTVYMDFWAWTSLTKIPAKVGNPPSNNIPVAGQWTYNLEAKEVVLAVAPNTTAPQDMIFADLEVYKVLAELDLGNIPPLDQTSISNIFYGTQPFNLSNSEVALDRPLAKIEAIDYGTFLLSTNTANLDNTNGYNSPIVINYSFFLPRLDLLMTQKEPDQYGNRVVEVKGLSDPIMPWVEVPQTTLNETALLYVTYVSSQDYNNNNIVALPWYSTADIDKDKVYLTNGSIHFFSSDDNFISSRGLNFISQNVNLDKFILNNDYELVVVTDPIGITSFRNRNPQYNTLDQSQCIFVSIETGSDASNGLTKNTPVKTLQNAINLTTSARPYVVIIRPEDLNESVYSSVTISKGFKVYIIAEYIAAIPQITVQSTCYLQGLDIGEPSASGLGILILNGHNLTAKYCNIQTITTVGYPSNAATYAAINVAVYNSIIEIGGIVVLSNPTAPLNITGLSTITLQNVFIRSDAQILNFSPGSYNITAANTFTFNNITNGLGHTGTVITTASNVSQGLNITINNSILPANDAVGLTSFATNAVVSINTSLTYKLVNSGTGSIVTENSQVVDVGDIGINTISGASNSIARGYPTDSFAINYIDWHIDAGAFLENRIELGIANQAQPSITESFMHLHFQRLEYRYNTLGDKFSFWIRFQLMTGYNTTFVLFDTRYDGDFNATSGLWNLNGNEFIQIVYDNNTYNLSYLDNTKYCFKAIFSNSFATYVAVVGPYFTALDNQEFGGPSGPNGFWHELGVIFSLSNLYDNMYNAISGTGISSLSPQLLGSPVSQEVVVDGGRKQSIILTIWDGKIDKIYALSLPLYEDLNGNQIANSNWYPGLSVSNFFNIGGGWSGEWDGTAWSTWTANPAHITIDRFLVSHDIIPANILLGIGSREVVDLNANDWRVGRWDDKDSALIIHCQNPEPFSENGISPAPGYEVSFRPYEGFEGHAIAIEELSPNLIQYGMFQPGNWFDRGAANQWATGPVTIYEELEGVGPGIAVLDKRGGNLVVDIINTTTSAITNTITLWVGPTLTFSPPPAVMDIVGSNLVIGYIYSDTSYHYNIVNTATYLPGYAIPGGALIPNTTGATYIAVAPGLTSSQAIFTYEYSGLGYIEIIDVTTNTIIAGPTAFSVAPVTFNIANTSTDKNGNSTYTIFYVDSATNYLNYVMYNSTLTATVYPIQTLIQTDKPTHLESNTFGAFGNTDIKWVNNTDMVTGGNCESLTAPFITAQTPAATVGATWAQNSLIFHTGSDSYKLTKSGAGVAQAFLGPYTLTNTPPAMSGFVAGHTYQIGAWIYIPSQTVVNINDFGFVLAYYNSGAWTYPQATPVATYNAWQYITTSVVIPGSATGAASFFQIAAAEASGTICYFDDIEIIDTANPTTVKTAIINNTGLLAVGPIAIYANADTGLQMDDILLTPNNDILFAVKDFTTQYIKFSAYNSTLQLISNSTYLRPYNANPVGGKVLLSTINNSNDLVLVTDNIVGNADFIILATDVPTLWYKDFTGVFENFVADVDLTNTLYGDAAFINFAHEPTAQETNVFVADAETGNLSQWTTNFQSGGVISITTTPQVVIHGNHSFQFQYDGSGNALYLSKNAGLNPGNNPTLYGRFYIQLDAYFTMTGVNPQLVIAQYGPSTNPLVLSLVYNSVDRKYKISATAGAYGSFTTPNSVIDYSGPHYIDMEWVNNVSAGGFAVWVDGVSVYSGLTYNTSSLGNPAVFILGNTVTQATPPSSAAKIYFDDANSGYTGPIGAYIAGLGLGQIWQTVTVTQPGQYFISGYFSVTSGNFVLTLESTSTGAGGALSAPIQYTFSTVEYEGDVASYIHNTQGTDTVNNFTLNDVNFGRIARFTIGFTIPPSGSPMSPSGTTTLPGYINVRIQTPYVSGSEIDDFFVDNIKLEFNPHSTSIITAGTGNAFYDVSLKEKGNAYFRVTPEFFYNTTSNHTIFSGHTTNALGATYVTHELYYSAATQQFIFYVQNLDATTVQVASAQYGTAMSIPQFTDLNSPHTIVINWDLFHGYLEMYIDMVYYNTMFPFQTRLTTFKESDFVVVGNRYDLSRHAGCLYDLIRIGETPLSTDEVLELTLKNDPFVHPSETYIGSTGGITGLSFFGLTDGDLYNQTIYSEQVGNGWNLVIDTGNNFLNNFVVNVNGSTLATFSPQGVVVNGSLQVTNLIAQTTTTLSTTGDNITLRFGFTGIPGPSNNGYFQVDRGNLNDSQIIWLEAIKAWAFNDGSNTNISIDGTSIGTWNPAAANWSIDINASGTLTFLSGTTTNSVTTPRTGGVEMLRINSSEVAFNNSNLQTVNLRASGGARDHLLFVNTNLGNVTVGRSAGLLPALTPAGYTPLLGVDTLLSVVNINSNNFGTIVFAENAGTVAGHIGWGNFTVSPTYWEIATRNGQLRVWGADLILGNTDGGRGIASTGLGLSFFEDTINARLAYTSNAQIQTTGTSLAGVYCWGAFTAFKVFNNVWNDYAEAFDFDRDLEKNPQPGFVYEQTEKGLVKSTRRASRAAIGIYSDTYGQLMGSEGKLYDGEHLDGSKIPIGLMGKVKVWVKEKLEIGDVLVSAPNGFATKANEYERMFSDLILAKVLETSTDDTEKRIWVLVK